MPASLRPFERRAALAYPYFKLATFDERSFTFKDGKRAFPTEDAARESAGRGTFRVSTITESGRTDGEPFTL